jgi:hypothetical protein
MEIILNMREKKLKLKLVNGIVLEQTLILKMTNMIKKWNHHKDIRDLIVE